MNEETDFITADLKDIVRRLNLFIKEFENASKGDMNDLSIGFDILKDELNQIEL